MYALVESLLTSDYIKKLKNRKKLDDVKLARYIKAELIRCKEFMEERDKDYYLFLRYRAGCHEITECNYYDGNLKHLIFTIGQN